MPEQLAKVELTGVVGKRTRGNRQTQMNGMPRPINLGILSQRGDADNHDLESG